MTVLSDKTLKKLVADGTLYINPEPKDNQFQPSSIDLKLDYIFTKYLQEKIPCIDTRNKYLNLDHDSDTTTLKYSHEPYIIQPDDFILAQTIEKVRIPKQYVAIVEGRSSFGRLGLMIHSTAGFIDPGFEGNITLEIKNINTIPIAIYPEQRICQLVVHELDDMSDRLYGDEYLRSKYQFQKVPTVSKIEEDD